MAATTARKPIPIYTGADVPDLTHPVSVNIKPLIDSIAGKLTDDEIDQWFVDLHIANEERGLDLEMTGEGELIISPMVNRGGGRSEFRLLLALGNWEEQNGGEAYGANANMSLPDGSRIRPDACGCRRNKSPRCLRPAKIGQLQCAPPSSPKSYPARTRYPRCGARWTSTWPTGRSSVGSLTPIGGRYTSIAPARMSRHWTTRRR